MFRMILLITRGILFEPRTRRWTMAILLAISLTMIAAGCTFAAPDLSTPLAFILYWGVCGWITVASLLLGVWDILMPRMGARHDQQSLQNQRRWAMLILLSAAMLMVFIGSTFLGGGVLKPLAFIVYWGICAWLTLASLLLAMWDVFLLRAAARREQRRLKQKFFEEPPDDHA